MIKPRAQRYTWFVLFLKKGWQTHTHTHHNRIFQVWYSSKCVRASCDGWWWGINMYMWCVCAISIPRLVMMMIWLMCDVMWWTQMGSDHKHTNEYTNIRVSCGGEGEWRGEGLHQQQRTYMSVRGWELISSAHDLPQQRSSRLCRWERRIDKDTSERISKPLALLSLRY